MFSSKDDFCSVRVLIRVKNAPGNNICTPEESNEKCCEIVELSSKAKFTFDFVLPQNADQEKVFSVSCREDFDVVARVLDGYNACFMAYGQTSSGKTFTMFGPDGGAPNSLAEWSKHIASGTTLHSQVGVAPRLICSLFDALDSKPPSEFEYVVEASCVELYNERFNDLLRESDHQQTLRIREDRGANGKGIFVEGASIKRVLTARQACDLLVKAAELRHVASTQMNATSSRSHIVFMLFVETVDAVRGSLRTTSRIFFADLAGSERIEKTAASGERLKEARTINLSLTLLGNVINKLTDQSSLHIPYRDSMLTRLLQDCLGGNSITTMLCTVSPEENQSSETLSTLMFAQRAKRMSNRPTPNRVASAEEMSKELQSLRQEVILLKERLHDFDGVLSLKQRGSQLDDQSIESMTTILSELHQIKSELAESERERLAIAERLRFHLDRENEMSKAWEKKFQEEAAAHRITFSKLDELMLSSTRTMNSGQQSAVKPFYRRESTPSISRKLDSEESLDTVKQHSFIRERMLLIQVDAMQGELSDLRKCSVSSEKLAIQVRELKAELDKANNHFDQRLAELTSDHAAATLKLKETIDELQESLAFSEKNLKEFDHLRLENSELHAENRANGMRLVDFTKRIDILTREVNELKEERHRLNDAVENANMDSQVKHRLLELSQWKGSKDKSYFRKKLLECFSCE